MKVSRAPNPSLSLKSRSSLMAGTCAHAVVREGAAVFFFRVHVEGVRGCRASDAQVTPKSRRKPEQVRTCSPDSRVHDLSTPRPTSLGAQRSPASHGECCESSRGFLCEVSA